MLVSFYNNLVAKYPVSKVTGWIDQLSLLALRLWIADIFFKSGRNKIADWETTLYLFAEVHPVPLLPVNVAAFLATASELIFPVLVAIGIFSRLTVVPLLFMTIIIEAFILPNPQHYYWILMMAIIVARGSGSLSADHFLQKKFGFNKI